MLDEYFGFEVEAGGESQVFVCGSCEAVDASVLAAAVVVDRGGKWCEAAVVGGDDVPGAIRNKLRQRMTLGSIIIRIVHSERRLRIGVRRMTGTLETIR